jgi:hypothetical protein
VPGLNLRWSHIVTLEGANTAPGAYLQGAGAGGGDAPDGGEPTAKPDDKAKPPA